MKRRRFLSLAAAAPLAATRVGWCGAEVPREPRHALPDHLRALAAHALEVRQRALDELTTAESVRRRQAWVRETLWRLAGGMPARTPLSLRVTGTLERPGYRVEKLVYESRPGLHVTANLHVPTGRQGPFPGVLFQMGHLAAGKAAEPYQRACQALVKRGHVVLAFDPVGEGERVDAPGPDGRTSRLASPDDEHDRTGAPLLLAGETQAGIMLWDAVRSLDVLAARPEVDPARLASVGHSGGGTLTMLLAAVDDRLAAAAISCANTEDVVSPGFEPPGAIDDAEQDLPGAGPLGLDRWDLVYPLAPRPLLVLVSTGDPLRVYSPAYLTNGREQCERLRRAYALLGAEDRVRWVETAEPHGLSRERRLEVTRWLGRVLLPEAPPVDEEPETAPEPEEATWVLPGGNVVRALGGKTPLDLARERAGERPLSRPVPDLGALVGVRPWPGATATVLASTSVRGCDVDDLEVASAPAVRLPAWRFQPRAPRATALVLSPEGRGRRDDGAWQALTQAGYAVCLADVRGTGALAPELGRGASGYARAHTPEQSYAWASLVLGESLLAQQVTDILALVAALGEGPLGVAAQDALTIPALFAAALDRRIGTLYLDGGLASYRSVLDAADPVCGVASVLPGVLAWTDLPEVAATIGPRRVILAGPVDGAGRPMALAEARALHVGAGNVEVTPDRGFGAATVEAVLRP